MQLGYRKVVQDIKSVFESPFHSVVGLAAPQVGHPLRVIGYQIHDKSLMKEKKVKEPVPLTFLVNPVLQVLERETKWAADTEACESVPHYHVVVKRPSRVHVKAWDLNGKDVSFEAEGYLARVLHHECDHLDGMTMIDRMERQTLCNDKYLGEFQQIRK
jgi:peptide deformylase